MNDSTHDTLPIGGSTRPAPPRDQRWTDRAEGVISTAIAVLIIAFLGVGMWVGFKAIFDDATANTKTQVEQIGK